MTAGAAGRAPVFTVGVDRDAAKAAVTLADGLAAGGALGADGVAQGGVLHVAAGEDRAVIALDSGADREAGIGDIGVHRGLFGLAHQFSVGHVCISFLLMYLFSSSRFPSSGSRRADCRHWRPRP